MPLLVRGSSFPVEVGDIMSSDDVDEHNLAGCVCFTQVPTLKLCPQMNATAHFSNIRILSQPAVN